LYLVELRASQINGCSIFVDVRSRELKLAGDPDERIFSIAACREAPYYSDEERAALALTEAATRLADYALGAAKKRVGERGDCMWGELLAGVLDGELRGPGVSAGRDPHGAPCSGRLRTIALCARFVGALYGPISQTTFVHG